MLYAAERLKEGIERGEFIPFYQPIVSSDTKKIMGCEVLARWITQDKGLITASEFIDDITHSQLTTKLTYSIWETVMADFSDTSDSYKDGDFFLTINVELSMILDPACSNGIINICNDLKEQNVTVIIEITEREDITQYPWAKRIFQDLEAKGVIFAIDDFGSGFSTEKMGQASKARFIKIDRQYVTIPPLSMTQTFVDEVMLLAKKEGAIVIGEGVETALQEKWLTSKGVDFLQGYRYGPAMPYNLFHYIYRQEQHTDLLPVD